MNTGTAIGSFVFAFVIVVIIGVLIGRMLRGWKRRARRQMDLLGELPALPDLLGSATVAPTRGLYIGSTLAPNWLERIAAGDLGYRSKAVLTRYPEASCSSAPARRRSGSRKTPSPPSAPSADWRGGRSSPVAATSPTRRQAFWRFGGGCHQEPRLIRLSR